MSHTEGMSHITMLRFVDLQERKIVPNRTTLQRWQERESDPFPQAIRLGPNYIAWRLSDVESWLERRASTSPEEAAIASRNGTKLVMNRYQGKGDGQESEPADQ